MPGRLIITRGEARNQAMYCDIGQQISQQGRKWGTNDAVVRKKRGNDFRESLSTHQFLQITKWRNVTRAIDVFSITQRVLAVLKKGRRERKSQYNNGKFAFLECKK